MNIRDSTHDFNFSVKFSLCICSQSNSSCLGCWHMYAIPSYLWWRFIKMSYCTWQILLCTISKAVFCSLMQARPTMIDHHIRIKVKVSIQNLIPTSCYSLLVYSRLHSSVKKMQGKAFIYLHFYIIHIFSTLPPHHFNVFFFVLFFSNSLKLWNWYLFTYFRFAYSHFTYCRPKSAASPMHKNSGVAKARPGWAHDRPKAPCSSH